MRVAQLTLVSATAMAVLLMSGCASSPAPRSDLCVPQLKVAPSLPRPGDTITVTTKDHCDVDVPANGWLVVAAPVGELQAAVREVSRERIDGTFEMEVPLPSDFPAGEAFVRIENWDYSECSGSGSCASASGSFTVMP